MIVERSEECWFWLVIQNGHEKAVPKNTTNQKVPAENAFNSKSVFFIECFGRHIVGTNEQLYAL